MKQQINTDQFNELNDKQKRELELWCFTNSYFTRLAVPGEPARFTDTKTFINYVLNPIELSIGQMIEFLDDDYINVLYQYDNGNPAFATSVCDALWQAVKEELENVKCKHKNTKNKCEQCFEDKFGVVCKSCGKRKEIFSASGNAQGGRDSLCICV